MDRWHDPGLETRGIRPLREHRGLVARFVHESIGREIRLLAPTVSHEMLWGVPCGPTLSMVHPPVLRGILWEDDGEV